MVAGTSEGVESLAQPVEVQIRKSFWNLNFHNLSNMNICIAFGPLILLPLLISES
jgi:hypothetical protein